MESLKELYKIGVGPSSSHTMGPMRAALRIKEMYPRAARYHVELYGSLSLTGRGHMTDVILKRTLAPASVSVSFRDEVLPFHPNGMIFHAYTADGTLLCSEEVYSVGGGIDQIGRAHV